MMRVRAGGMEFRSVSQAIRFFKCGRQTLLDRIEKGGEADLKPGFSLSRVKVIIDGVTYGTIRGASRSIPDGNEGGIWYALNKSKLEGRPIKYKSHIVEAVK